MKLWRPVGAAELALIEASGWRSFPPRLADQPIFYPVLNFAYAEQIARDWNARNGEEGFVLEFEVNDLIEERYPAQIVGGKVHKELWVPAEELDAFNAAIEGEIKLVARYRDGVRVEG